MKYKIDVMLDEGAYLPERAHILDAGMDLRSRENKVIYKHNSATFDTGVHMAIPEGYVGFLKSKSGLNVNHGLKGEGVIDSGYTGSIVVKLYNDGDQDYEVKRGDKISQIVIIPVLLDGVREVKNLEDSERGSNGFGSTGK